MGDPRIGGALLVLIGLVARQAPDELALRPALPPAGQQAEAPAASGSAVVRDLRETVLLQNQDPFAGGDKWEGGVVGADGSLYCMPMRSKTVLRITGAREESLSWTCAP